MGRARVWRERAAGERVQCRLVRGEMLIASGRADMAAAGLRRLLAETVDMEEAAARAWSQELLGRACIDHDTDTARRYLSRARHLYETMRATYSVVACEIDLARIEVRLGLNPRGRLEALESKDLSRWPLLAVELAVVRAEMAPSAEATEASLLEARRQALAMGYVAAAKRADRLMRRQADPIDLDLEELTPVNTYANGEISRTFETVLDKFEDTWGGDDIVLSTMVDLPGDPTMRDGAPLGLRAVF